MVYVVSLFVNLRLFVAQSYVLVRKFLVSLESPDKHSLLVSAIPLSLGGTLNTTKLLGSPAARNRED